MQNLPHDIDFQKLGDQIINFYAGRYFQPSLFQGPKIQPPMFPSGDFAKILYQKKEQFLKIAGTKFKINQLEAPQENLFQWLTLGGYSVVQQINYHDTNLIHQSDTFANDYSSLLSSAGLDAIAIESAQNFVFNALKPTIHAWMSSNPSVMQHIFFKQMKQTSTYYALESLFIKTQKQSQLRMYVNPQSVPNQNQRFQQAQSSISFTATYQNDPFRQYPTPQPLNNSFIDQNVYDADTFMNNYTVGQKQYSPLSQNSPNPIFSENAQKDETQKENVDMPPVQPEPPKVLSFSQFLSEKPNPTKKEVGQFVQSVYTYGDGSIVEIDHMLSLIDLEEDNQMKDFGCPFLSELSHALLQNSSIPRTKMRKILAQVIHEQFEESNLEEEVQKIEDLLTREQTKAFEDKFIKDRAVVFNGKDIKQIQDNVADMVNGDCKKSFKAHEELEFFFDWVRSNFGAKEPDKGDD